MGATKLTPTQIALQGTVPETGFTPAGVTVDEANGNYFENTGRCFIYLLGGTAGAITVTIDSPSECGHGFEHDVTITPVAATVYLLGRFPKSRFDDSDGYVQITYGAGAAADLMKIQIFELP